MPTETGRSRAREWVARGFTIAEDIVYVGLGLFLVSSALTLLVAGAIDFGKTGWQEKSGTIALLDRILLILLIVELLYTVQVSFREHALLPEPFLVVGLISAIRRVLLVTAEFGEANQRHPNAAQNFAIELGVLTVLILAIVGALVLLSKNPVSAKRA
jgi:uncharacterized membrane protein (DUF373 family)